MNTKNIKRTLKTLLLCTAGFQAADAALPGVAAGGYGLYRVASTAQDDKTEIKKLTGNNNKAAEGLSANTAGQVTGAQNL